ncbi:MAG: methionyl-tRNA formyltransferase [Steroidobacteraceae bacterium]
MRIALLGQQKFGKAVFDAFVDRGHTIAGVFCAPDKPGTPPDPIKAAAEARAIPVHQLPTLKSENARDILRALKADLGVMAYVLQFVPEEFTAIPVHGMIQYHPSLLPRYRGPSAINWPIIRGDTVTGLTIFRPTNGLDEGPVILQKETPIGPDDTLGGVYFERLFPMGVAALLEAAELVAQGLGSGTAQDESHASYEGWCRAPESRINWHNHADIIYDLIRGCDPAPGAWTMLNGKKLQLFEARKHPVRRFSQIAAEVGAVSKLGERSLHISAHGGEIEVFKVKYGDGDKLPAAQFCAAQGVAVGTLLGA